MRGKLTKLRNDSANSEKPEATYKDLLAAFNGDDDLLKRYWNDHHPDTVIPKGDDIDQNTKIVLGAFLEDAIEEFDGDITSLGDDAQLQMLDLQQALQRQTQMIGMMAAIQKSMHDTVMDIIRKIGS